MAAIDLDTNIPSVWNKFERWERRYIKSGQTAIERILTKYRNLFKIHTSTRKFMISSMNVDQLSSNRLAPVFRGRLRQQIFEQGIAEQNYQDNDQHINCQ